MQIIMLAFTAHISLDFGNRPRKLYVIINLTSGSGPNSVNRTWQRVLRMFQLANIHTDVLRESQLLLYCTRLLQWNLSIVVTL